VLFADLGDLQATPTVELLHSSGVINRGLMAQAPSGGKPVSLTSLPAEQLMSIREQARSFTCEVTQLLLGSGVCSDVRHHAGGASCVHVTAKLRSSMIHPMKQTLHALHSLQLLYVAAWTGLHKRRVGISSQSCA